MGDKAGIIYTRGTQLISHFTFSTAKALAVFLLLTLSSCGRISPTGENASLPTTVPSVTMQVVPSLTPFVPELNTPTPSILHLWLSPTLPEPLTKGLIEVTSISGHSIEIVQEKIDADVRVEPWAEVPLTQWIYAVVVPFPTLQDGLTSEELETVWDSDHPEFQTIYLPKDELSTIEALFDGLPAENSFIMETDKILEQVWLDPSGIAIVPFEDLETRWKVLEIDGSSPIRKDFDADSYPLTVTFGLSGDPDAIAPLIDAIEWPTSNRDPNKLTILVMTGVTALTRATAWTMEQKGYKYPAEKIAPWLLEADFTHISNEVSFYELCPTPTPSRAGLTFCSDPDYIELLQAIDVDIIELTGNHLKDYGEEPLVMTLDLYRQNEWGIFGGGSNLEKSLEPLIMEHNGNKLAFLGCNAAGPYSDFAGEESAGATPCDYEKLYPQLQSLKSEGYLTIFTFQWNEYYQAKPITNQVDAFREAIDAGAMIVSGSQAHQPQAMEFYNNGFIHYGLGNLFFDQMWGIQVRQEFVDRYVFYEGKHISIELLTAFLEDYAQPRPMTAEERQVFLQEIFQASGW